MRSTRTTLVPKVRVVHRAARPRARYIRSRSRPALVNPALFERRLSETIDRRLFAVINNGLCARVCVSLTLEHSVAVSNCYHAVLSLQFVFYFSHYIFYVALCKWTGDFYRFHVIAVDNRTGVRCPVYASFVPLHNWSPSILLDWVSGGQLLSIRWQRHRLRHPSLGSTFPSWHIHQLLFISSIATIFWRLINDESFLCPFLHFTFELVEFPVRKRISHYIFVL